MTNGKRKFTTTLDADLLRNAKLEAVRRDKKVNDLIELGLKIVIERSKVVKKK